MKILDKREQIRLKLIALDYQIEWLNILCEKAYRSYNRKCDWGFASFNILGADVLLYRYESIRDALKSLAEYKEMLNTELSK